MNFEWSESEIFFFYTKMSKSSKVDENIRKYVQRVVKEMKTEILNSVERRVSEICKVVNPISLTLQKGEKLVISLQVSFEPQCYFFWEKNRVQWSFRDLKKFFFFLHVWKSAPKVQGSSNAATAATASNRAVDSKSAVQYPVLTGLLVSILKCSLKNLYFAELLELIFFILL